MVTKSGKHHYLCIFRLYEPDGSLIYEDKQYKFTAKDPLAYVQKHETGYIHRRAEFTNIIDLDKEYTHDNPV